ncbi:30S ribosomal protein S11 [Patescibacteria group bacterium]|nr:30S ribosomal protein S11 [Patescibacteria group bacterium]
MGKKRIIQKTEEELIKEREKVEAGVKDVKTKAVSGTREGRIYISSSYNNTIITLTDEKGNKLTAASAGSIGFKGAKKATPFAASKVAEGVSLTAKKLRIERVAILVKGIGSGRDSAIRSLAGHGLEIISVEDVTPVPHNGCRPRKVRRV